jgi:hypothetical protein
MKEKLQSRKFHVFLIWCALIVFLAVNNQITPEILKYFMIVCVMYIGGNVAQKYLFNKQLPLK